MKEQHSNENTDKNNIEIWEDFVSIRDLVISLIIMSITTLGGYLMAADDPTRPLIFGLFGALIGFIITSIIIQPKRTFRFKEEEE